MLWPAQPSGKAVPHFRPACRFVLYQIRFSRTICAFGVSFRVICAAPRGFFAGFCPAIFAHVGGYLDTSRFSIILSFLDCFWYSSKEGILAPVRCPNTEKRCRPSKRQANENERIVGDSKENEEIRVHNPIIDENGTYLSLAFQQKCD